MVHFKKRFFEIRLLLFTAVMLLYLWFPYSLIRNQNLVLQEGQSYRFALYPVDPVDAFRGRYIDLVYQNLPLPSPDLLSQGQQCYVTVGHDDQGFAYFTAAYAQPPATGDYLRTRVVAIEPGKVIIDIPDSMNRYYLNEKMAPLAEKYYQTLLLRQNDEPEKKNVYADVRIKEGKAALESVYFDDLPVEEYLRRRNKQ